jgi:hypothetical protein
MRTLLLLPLLASCTAASPSAPTQDLPPTLMTTRGTLLLAEDFTKQLTPPTGSTARFASGYAGWRFNVEARGGHWDAGDGAFRGAEKADHKHPATASYGFDFKDVVIQCDVKLHDVPMDGRRSRYFNLRTTDAKDYVCTIILTPNGMRIQKDDNDHAGPDVAVPLGELKTPVPLDEWQTVVFEILGEEMVGTLNGRSLSGTHPLIGTAKKSIMFVSGVETSVRNLRIWEALPNAGWPKNREALKAAAGK